MTETERRLLIALAAVVSMLPDTSDTEAQAIADLLRRLLKEGRAEGSGGKEVKTINIEAISAAIALLNFLFLGMTGAFFLMGYTDMAVSTFIVTWIASAAIVIRSLGALDILRIQAITHDPHDRMDTHRATRTAGASAGREHLGTLRSALHDRDAAARDLRGSASAWQQHHDAFRAELRPHRLGMDMVRAVIISRALGHCSHPPS